MVIQDKIYIPNLFFEEDIEKLLIKFYMMYIWDKKIWLEKDLCHSILIIVIWF